MKVKYSDNYIRRLIVEHNDILIEKVDSYYLVKSSSNNYYFAINQYNHCSDYMFSTLEELKEYLGLKESK